MSLSGYRLKGCNYYSYSSYYLGVVHTYMHTSIHTHVYTFLHRRMHTQIRDIQMFLQADVHVHAMAFWRREKSLSSVQGEQVLT